MSGGFHTLGEWFDDGTEIAVILAVDVHGRVLLQLRDDFPQVALGGWWGLFGGHVEPNEVLIDAAAREFSEETGLNFPQTNFQPFVRLNSPDGFRHYVYLLTVPIDAAKISLQEGAGFAFVHKGQLDEMNILPSARSVLDHYYATVSQ